MPLIQHLDRAIKAAGVPVDSVSPDATAPGGYRVSPPSLQAAAQPTIDAFNPNDTAHEQADLDAQVKHTLEVERLFSAIVWTIIDTYSSPTTIAKYTTARANIIAAYKTRPWKA
mgnify:CR=1 FL=1